LDKKELSQQCANCARNTVRGYVICSDCIGIFEDATGQKDSRFLQVAARLKLSDLETLEKVVNARKFMMVQSHKLLFEHPPGGRFSPQTRMDPDFLALSLGSVRAQRAVVISAEWLYEGICEIVGSHSTQVIYQNTEIYLNTMAFFMNISGRYALSLGGGAFRDWLQDRIIKLWIRDALNGVHLGSVNYIKSSWGHSSVDVSTQLIGFVQSCEKKYETCDVTIGTLLEDMLGQHTLIGVFQEAISNYMSLTTIEDVVAIRLMVRHIMVGILDQSWLRDSISDAVIEN
jgi:hypothetical protein